MNDKQFKKVIRDNGAGTYTFDKDTYPGLYYRVSPQGKVAWVYRYTRPTGKPAQPKLGDYETEGAKGKDWHMGIANAGAKWTEWRNLLKKGIDPQKQVKEQIEAATARQAVAKETAAKDGLTVDRLRKDYVNVISTFQKNGLPLLKSWKPVSRTLERALDSYCELPAIELSRQNVKGILMRLRSDGSPVMANRTLAAIRSMYNWAIKNDWPYHTDAKQDGIITTNPCWQIEATEEIARDHVLSKTELKKLLKNLPKSELSDDQQDLILFTLHTGCRIGEACNMRWDEVHGDEWIQPGIKTKNGSSHTVFLTAPVLAILERHKGGEWVFSSKTTDSGHLRVDGVEKQLRLSMDKLKVRPHRIHDYRRSFASWMGDQGIDETVHDRVLNHVRKSVRKTYNTAKYNQPAKDAWLQWATHLQELQTSEKGTQS